MVKEGPFSYQQSPLLSRPLAPARQMASAAESFAAPVALDWTDWRLHFFGRAWPFSRSRCNPRITPRVSSFLATRREERSREICGGAARPLRRVIIRLLIIRARNGIPHDRLAVKVPGRMPENGHHHCQTEKERHRAGP